MRFAAGSQRDDTGAGAAVLAHADFVERLGQNQEIKQFQQFEQRAPAIGRGPVSDLAYDDILVKTIELAHARGQQLEQNLRIQLAQKSHGRCSLPRLAVAQNLAEIDQRRLPKFVDQLNDAIALLAFLRAEKTVGEVFHRILGKLLQDLDKILGQAVRVNRLLNHLRQAVFNADARTQVLHQRRPVLGYSVQGGAEFRNRLILLAGASFLPEARHGCA